MKRKFKQWWSIISPISTKRTITFHLYSLNTKKHHDICQTDKCWSHWLYWELEGFPQSHTTSEDKLNQKLNTKIWTFLFFIQFYYSFFLNYHLYGLLMNHKKIVILF
jgi:hypothetical protein